MNKQELKVAVHEKLVADDANISLALTGNVIEATIDTIIDSLGEGDSVAIRGFGTFAVSERAARSGHNPATGKKIKIPAHKLPKFKASKVFKEAIGK